jgi:hypothetical protein
MKLMLADGDLREHFEAFLNAYNFAERLKALNGLRPYAHICKVWADAAQPIQLRSTPPHFGTEQTTCLKLRWSACILIRRSTTVSSTALEASQSVLSQRLTPYWGPAKRVPNASPGLSARSR